MCSDLSSTARPATLLASALTSSCGNGLNARILASPTGMFFALMASTTSFAVPATDPAATSTTSASSHL